MQCHATESLSPPSARVRLQVYVKQKRCIVIQPELQLIAIEITR